MMKITRRKALALIASLPGLGFLKPKSGQPTGEIQINYKQPIPEPPSYLEVNPEWVEAPYEYSFLNITGLPFPKNAGETTREIKDGCLPEIARPRRFRMTDSGEMEEVYPYREVKEDPDGV